ncbi:MAG: hypothetical protein QGI09_07465, partial [Dehalococcoidia bacterium]|nr:hypothetical protein [Dehalococcoidia bacterium]
MKSTTTDSSGFYSFNVPADNLDTLAKDGGEEGETVVLYVGASSDGFTDSTESFQATFGIGSTPPARNMTVPAERVLTLATLYSPIVPEVGQTVSLLGTVATQTLDDVASATVNVTWDDGGTSEGTTNTAGGVSLTHVYSSAGSMSIQVTASKSGYVPASVSFAVVVSAAAATATPGPSGGGGGGGGFFPPVPTPTLTPTPTPTLTPTPTPTPTVVPTATPYPTYTP